MNDTATPMPAQNAPEQKRRRRFLRLAAAAFSLVICVALAVLAATAGGLYWLNSTKDGQQFITARLSEITQATGYQVTLGHPHLAGAGSIRIDSLDVADAQGVFFSARDLKLSLSVLALASKRAVMSGRIGTADLLRLPEPQAPATETEQPIVLAPFTVPDIYFTHIGLHTIAIDRLHIAEGVAGAELVLQPELTAAVDLSPDTLTMAVTLDTGSQDALLPRHAELEGSLNTRALDADVKTFSIKGDGYTLEGSGKGNLAADGIIEAQLSAKADADTLKAASADYLSGGLEANTKISGSLKHPAIVLNAKISDPVINGTAAGDITLDFTLPDTAQVAGTAELSTVWQDAPVKLHADTSWADPKINFENITLTGPDLKADGNLAYDTQAGLVDGKIAARANIARYAALASVKVSGTAEAAVTLTPKDNLQAADITTNVRNIVYDNLNVKKIDATATFSDLFTLRPQKAHVTLTGLSQDDMRINTADLTITPKGSADAFDATLSATGSAVAEFKLKASALLHAGIDATTTQGSQNFSATHIAATATVTKAGTLNLQGSAAADKIDLSLKAKDFSLRALPGMPRVARRNAVSGTVTMTGTAAAPVTSADIAITPLPGKKKRPAVSLVIKAQHKDNLLKADISGKGNGISTLKAHLDYPLRFALQPFTAEPVADGQLAGTLTLNGDMAALSALALDEDTALTGRIDAQGKLSGTPAAPRTTGSATWKDGSIDMLSTGVHLVDIGARVGFDGDTIKLADFKATDGKKGSLQAQGSVAIGDKGLPIDASVKMKDMDFLENNRNVDGLFGAESWGFKGRDGDYLVNGSVNADTLQINIPEQLNDNIPELNVVDKKQTTPTPDLFKTIRLDVAFDAPSHIFVRGWGLDAEFGGSLHASGTLDAPIISGDMSSIRGRYEEFGRRFDLDHAILHFRGPVPPSPFLDISAKADVEDITAEVILGGSVTTPKITFSSVPALPDNEVLSRILFGKDMSHISPFQALELARTLRRLSGKGGGPDPLGTLRGSLGLDDLQVGSSEDGGTTVGAGKYISDKVYLEVESGSGEKSGGANLRIEVTPSIKLESRVGQDATGGGGIFWEKDY